MDVLVTVVFFCSGAALILSFFSLINPRFGFGKTSAVSFGINIAIFFGLIIGLKIVMEIQNGNAEAVEKILHENAVDKIQQDKANTLTKDAVK